MSSAPDGVSEHAAPPRPLASIGLLAASFAAVTLVAALGGALTALGLGPWYDALPKPAWNPPAWVFGPVWTTLYALQAIAAWLVARAGWRAPGVRTALGLHALQLALQVAWSGLFFALRSPAGAVVVILAIVVAFALTTAAFRRVRPLAAALMLPTLAWVLFATALNLAIATGGR
jgi:tryptophan-rich sensory protein